MIVECNKHTQSKVNVTSNYILYPLLILLLTAFSGCKENAAPATVELTLPPYTEVGANTFGFTVNGKVYAAEGKRTTWPPQGTTSELEDNLFRITGSYFNSNVFWQFSLINLAITPSVLGTYEFTRETGLGLLRDESAPGDEATFFTNENHTGTLTISYWSQEDNIIAGTFSFDAYNQALDSVISVRDGRFDLEYNK